MSLLDEQMEKCILLDELTSPDGYGGVESHWSEGAGFDAAIVFNNSMEARIADKQGVTSLYTVTTRKNINLQYHKAFKRLSDGKIFRVTSDGDDNRTPASANLNMRNVSAEEWEIPNG